MPIDGIVYLKIRDRGIHNPEALLHLSEWIKGCEQNRLPYIISVGDYTGKLPSHSAEEIINNDWFKITPLGQQITKMVNKSPCDHSWRPAAYVHCLPYFHSTKSVTINIDADDVHHDLSNNTILERMINGFTKHNLFTLSYDVYFSVSIRLETRPHHWSFGINISRTEEFKNIIEKSLLKPGPPWIGFNNIDYLVDYWLEKNTEGPIAAILTEGRYHHGGDISYISGEDCVQLQVDRNRTIRPRHPRTILV